jgi:hypothetical protein
MTIEEDKRKNEAAIRELIDGFETLADWFVTNLEAREVRS